MYLPFKFAQQVKTSLTVQGTDIDNSYFQERHDEFVRSHMADDRDAWVFDCVTLWHKAGGEECPYKVKKGIYRINKLREEYQNYMSFEPMDKEDFMHNLLITTDVLEWLKSKRAYKVESDMFKTLCNMKLPESFYSDVLARVPFKSFFIDCDASYFGEGVSGILVTVGRKDDMVVYDICSLIQRKRIVPVHTTFMFPYQEDSDDRQVDTSSMSTFRDNVRVHLEDGFIVDYKERGVVVFVVNLLLYITASNNDVAYTERTEREYKPREATKYQVKEVEEFGVGYKYAKSISSSKPKVRYRGGTPRVTKVSTEKRAYSSHFRSAHWHSYWVNDEGGKKKRILKWVEGTFVHGNRTDSRATVQRVVK